MKHAPALLVTASLLAAIPATSQQAPQVQVTGQVFFADTGAPAEGARLALFRLADLRQSVVATTDATGRFTVLVPVDGSATTAVPRTFQLLQNYPNPFNPGTVIPYQLDKGGQVRLEVYNLLGQRVRLLVDSAQPAGYQSVAWDATDDVGQSVGAGIYLYQLTVDGLSDSRQMVLLDGPGGSTRAAGGRAPIPASPQAAASSAIASSAVYGLTVSGPGLVTY
ncbi:MAG: T9SS type A sorting domain-containing protein [Candidatus Latescibacterota bacterium]|jgi:hypothetical protein